MVDPTLLGPVKSCRILTQSITVRELTKPRPVRNP